jgi:hypothetical protein
MEGHLKSWRIQTCSDGIGLILSKTSDLFSAEYAHVMLLRPDLMAGAVKGPYCAGNLDKATIRQAVDSLRYVRMDEYRRYSNER